MKTWLLAVVLVLPLPLVADDILPWEIWKDPGIAAQVRSDLRTVVRSSVDTEGGAYDRHSSESSRFLRVADGEGVIFETEGAGAVTRIWMTQGDGISTDLDPTIRLRIRIDGAERPVVDLSLPDFFSGRVPPFLSPMVLDRRHSAGGNISYIPLPFRRGCRISLVNADNAKIWFQVSAMLLENDDGVVSYTGSEDLSDWRRMLGRSGADPWADQSQTSVLAQETVSGSVVLVPGKSKDLAIFDGPDQINGVVLRVPQERIGEVAIRMEFDGHTTVDMPMPWFFGVGSPTCPPVRSLFLGVDQGEAYSYFPMPYFLRAKISLELSERASADLRLDFAVRRAGQKPKTHAGIFSAEVIDVPTSNPGEEAIALDLRGPGRLAGLMVTGGSTESEGWAFLEGDERIIVDGEFGASWRGTGIEDFFGGGFYFRDASGRPTPFRRALHGLTCIAGTRQSPTASLYRLMPTDGPVFSRSLIFGVEGGPTGEIPVRWRGVAWHYELQDQN